jgi:hypothetical protein
MVTDDFENHDGGLRREILVQVYTFGSMLISLVGTQMCVNAGFGLSSLIP